MIKWLGENGGELVGTNKYLCVQKKDLCVQIRLLCRLHRGCSVRGSRMLRILNCAFRWTHTNFLTLLAILILTVLVKKLM
jgi:hypothetical protein